MHKTIKNYKQQHHNKQNTNRNRHNKNYKQQWMQKKIQKAIDAKK